MTTTLGPSNDKIPPIEWKLAHKEARAEHAWRLSIARSNKAFDTAGEAGKRIIIAKDVLNWLAAGKLFAKAGTYFHVPALYDTDADGFTQCNTPWGGADIVNGHTCTACAVGGAAVVLLERRGGARALGLEDVRDVGCEWKKILLPYFTESQLTEMETAFERDMSYGGSKAAKTFGCKYDNDGERMTAIFENIVANGGAFVP